MRAFKIISTIPLIIIFFCQLTFSFQVKVFGLYGDWVSTIVVDTTKLNTIYVGTPSDYSSGKTGFLSRTTDGGKNWEKLIINRAVSDIDIHPFNSNILYATMGWNGLTAPGILKSTDSGINWSKADSGILMYSDSSPHKLAIVPSNPGIMYAGTAGVMPGGFYKSTNGGISWNLKGDSTKLWMGVTAITINPDSNNIVYAGTNQSGHIYKSTDYGENWRYTGLSCGLTYTIEIDKPSSSIYVGARGDLGYKVGVFHSLDAGTIWKNLYKGIPDTIFDIKSVLIDTTYYKKRIFITGNNHKYQAKIYYKYEDDSSWSSMNLPDTLPQIHQLVSYNNKILFGTPRGLYIVEKPTNTVDRLQEIVVQSFSLNQNYPNPFNPSTTISYSLSKKSFVSLKIFDLLGKEIDLLVSENQQVGKYSLKWNASKFSSGIYFCRLESANQTITKKIVLIK